MPIDVTDATTPKSYVQDILTTRGYNSFIKKNSLPFKNEKLAMLYLANFRSEYADTPLTNDFKEAIDGVLAHTLYMQVRA